MHLHRYLGAWLALLLTPHVLAQAAPLQPWDGVPALDPLHLHGPHAGSRVCPMCRYGYDAGVLVILPADSPVASVAAVASTMLQLPVDQADALRFRRFLLFAGTPTAKQVAAAAVADLQVAQLEAAHLKAAEHALGRRLNAPWAFVFAQRRLLMAFDPLHPPGGLGAHVHYAQRFLREHYPEPVSGDDPDVQRGRLWLAPNRLHGLLRLGGDGARRELCLSDGSGRALAGSLIEAAAANGSRMNWARSDARGCVALQGDVEAGLHLRSFVPLQNTVEFDLSAPQMRMTEVLNLRSAAQPTLAATPALGPCEGCELALLGLPQLAPTTARLAPSDIAGDRLRIEGQVRDAQGGLAEGVIVYAYQTDATGRYPQPNGLLPSLRPHGSLRAWARTDAQGRYAFDTVRPGAYPERTEPQHVHMHLIEPGRCTYYLDDLVFDDDPLLTGRHRREPALARGGSGIVSPRWDGERWHVRRDLQLGLNVHEYVHCGS